MTGSSFIHRFLEAADGGEFDRLGDFLHEDVIVHAPMGLSTRNLEDEKQVWRDALVAMPGIRHDLLDVVEGDNFIAARGVVRGTMQGKFAGVEAAGRSFEVAQAWFMRLRDGKAEEVWEIVETGALLQQLGVITIDG